MDESMNNEVMETENDVVESYDLCERDSNGDAKAVVIGAAAAAVVTAGIYGGYKLVGKAKAAWKRHKLKKEAEKEIAQEEYDDVVATVREEEETE